MCRTLFPLACLILVACGAPPDGVAAPGDGETATGAEAKTAPLATQSPRGGQPEAVTAAIPDNLRALGTEPFWAAHVTGGRLRYLTPENQEGVEIDVQQEETPKGARILTGMLDDKPLRLEVTVEKCSDGMSDREYPYNVRLKLGDDLRAGCARPASE